MTPEGKVKAKVKNILNQRGAFWYMPMGTPLYSRNGIPDFLVCYKGVFIGIETKAGRGKTTKLQQMELQKIADAGGVGLVVNETNVYKVAAIIDAIDNGTWSAYYEDL